MRLGELICRKWGKEVDHLGDLEEERVVFYTATTSMEDFMPTVCRVAEHQLAY
jgi:hypothetical protein